jgi:hypothetical protein
MLPARSKVREALATVRGALFRFLVLAAPFIVIGVIALGRVLNDGPLEEFLVGSVPIPKFQGAGFNSIHVVVGCGVAIVALAIALTIRYFQHRGKLRALRSRGVTDFNGDGKPDVFTDRFLDDL